VVNIFFFWLNFRCGFAALGSLWLNEAGMFS